jgi:hypothetical protein
MKSEGMSTADRLLLEGSFRASSPAASARKGNEPKKEGEPEQRLGGAARH